MSAPPRLTMREVGWFFFPLLLNVQMMSISHSVINAALARVADAVTALAAFSVAMVVHIFIGSPSYQNHIITLAMVRGRRSLCSCALFIALMAAAISALLAVIAFTPLGDLFLRDLLGTTPAVAAGARRALALMVPLPFITGLRSFAQGLVSQTRRTGLISFATGVRIGGLFLLLWLGSDYFDGPALGAVALVGCVATETVLISWFAWRVWQLPDDGAKEHDFAAIVRFSLPLATSSGLQQAIPLLINAIISRLPDGTLALAAFGVVRGFVFLLAGPMRNLQQAFLALGRGPDDYPVLARFNRRVSLVLAFFTLAVAFPLNAAILGSLMGLDPALRTIIVTPLALCALYPWLIGAAHLLRGWFAQVHKTALLGRATFYKVLLLVTCWPLLGLFPLPLSGPVIAVLLLVFAEAAEIWYLQRRRQQLLTGEVPSAA